MASAATGTARRRRPPPGLHEALVEVLRRGVGPSEGLLLARLLGISTATAIEAMGEGGLRAVAVMEKRSLLTRSVHRLVAALGAAEELEELLYLVLDALAAHGAMAWAEPPPEEGAVAAGRSATPPRALAEEKQQQPTLVELWERAPPKAEGLDEKENAERGMLAAEMLTSILSGPKAGRIGLKLRMGQAARARMDRGEYEAATALLDGGFLTKPAKIDEFLAAVWAVGLQGQEYSVAAMFAPAAAREARNAVASTVEALRERVIVEEAYDTGREGDQFSVWQLYALVHATPSVCRIKSPSTSGTGFVVAEGVVLTARHVVERHLGAAWKAAEGGRQFVELSEPVRLQFNVSEDAAVAKIAGVPQGVQGVLLPAGTRVVAGEALDYCFLLVGGIQQFQDLAAPFRKPLPLATKEMQRRAVEDHLPLAVVHHPDGKPMHISLQTGEGPAGGDDPTKLLHRAPTQPGSSGAPVLAMDGGGVCVVSLHRAGETVGDESFINAEDGAASGAWHNLSLLLDAIGPPPSAAPPCLADVWRETFENDREVMGTAYALARPLLDAAAGVEELDAFARDHRLLEAVDSLETVGELVAFLADEAKAKPAHEIWALVGDACAKCNDTGELFDAKRARLRVLGAEAAVAKLEAALAIARAKLDKTTSASLRARRQRAVDELDQQLERRRHQ